MYLACFWVVYEVFHINMLLCFCFFVFLFVCVFFFFFNACECSYINGRFGLTFTYVLWVNLYNYLSEFMLIIIIK